MGSYTRTYSLSDGTTAYGSQVAFELDALGSSVNNIVNAQVSSGAAIADSKFAQITTPSKVSGAAITLLTSVPSGAGLLPIANVPIAAQSDMETGTSNSVVVTPGKTQNHPGVAKAWCFFDGTTVGTNAPTAGYNVTNVIRNSAGNYTVTFTTAMSSTSYCVVGSAYQNGSAAYVNVHPKTFNTGSTVVEVVDVVSDTVQDSAKVHVVCYGDQ